MNRFIKLINFEINRFSKLYIGILILTAISQIISIFLEKSKYMEFAKNANYASSLKAKEEFISSYGLLSFHKVTESILFVAPIGVCIAIILLYIFIIWYRDYFGKNTFVYRLFMLPTSRLTIFFAKASTILIMVLSLLAFQLILLPIEICIFDNIIPSDLLIKISTIDFILNNHIFYILLPGSFAQFLLSYGIGIAVVIALFTAILLERSFRWKGIVFGVLYCLTIIAIVISPLIMNDHLTRGYGFSFYSDELFMIELAIIVLITVGSIYLSNYLLKKKVSV